MPFLFALSLGMPAQDRKKPEKPPDIVVVETTARRDNGRVALDGKVRNAGERPIERLVLYFDFTAPGGGVVTRPKTQLETEVLQPGEEAEYHTEMVDPVRAVEFRVSLAQDSKKRDLRIANPGPFPVE